MTARDSGNSPLTEPRVVVTIGPSMFVMWLGLTRTNSGKGQTRYVDSGLGTVSTGGETSA